MFDCSRSLYSNRKTTKKPFAMIALRAKIFLQNIVGNGNLLPEKYRERIVVPVVMGVVAYSIVLMAAISVGISINNRDDLLQLGDSLYVFFGFFPWFLCYSHLLVNRERFHLLFIDVEDIILQRMNTEHRLYADAKKQIDSYLDLFRRTQTMPTFAVFFIPYVWIVYLWLIGEYTIDQWFYLIKVWVPFELNTSVRCASLVLFQILAASSTLSILYWVITMLVEFMLYTKAFIKDIKSMFGQMNRMAEEPKSTGLVIDHCKQIIVLQCRINRCMSQLADLTNFLNSSIVIPCVVDIVINLFVSEMFLDRTTFSKSIVPLAGTVSYFVLLFVCCYSGQMLHSDLMDLSDLIYQSEWYRYPPTVQRAILMMMMRAQQPFYLSIYGVVTLRLENYVEIIRRIYSALMIVRTMH